jgi:tetratricopeptide (TPR) repeat protein
MPNERQAWKRLIRGWKVGPACGYEEALRYTGTYPSKFGGWIVLADVLSTVARYAEAEQALRKAERLTPPELRATIWEHRGELYRAKNNLRHAERWFRKALDAKRTTRRHICLGATLAKQGRLDEALAQHRAAIRLGTAQEPIDEAHYNAALVLRAQGRYEQARNHLRQALRLDPKYPGARRTLRDLERALQRQ